MTMDTQLSLEAQTLARLVRDRHSCRAFRPESVPRDTIEQILDVARATPVVVQHSTLARPHHRRAGGDRELSFCAGDAR